MCDNILAPPAATVGQVMLFGKNSDRQRNEAQTVEYFPASEHAADANVACTYITIPQVRQTNAVLLCRPFWLWGAEMGANQHGVVIGNEGIHARSPPPQQRALTGMDLVRLALERAASAAAAVEVITTLLERHGQGGNGGHLTPAFYNNGFLIADAREAFVLETLEREWLVERVEGVRAMSNRYSIGRLTCGSSRGLLDLIHRSGWSAESQPSYADAIADPHREHIGNAGARQSCSTALLRSGDGQLTAADMIAILRDHGTGERHQPDWSADCLVRRTLCMHAGFETYAGQTVGSMVSEISTQHAVHWVTGTAAPCTSIFKPVLMDVPLPWHGPLPTDRFDPAALWWQHEWLHRTVAAGDFGRFVADIRAERDAIEAEFRARLQSVLNGGDRAERARVVAECWNDASEMEARWRREVPIATPMQEPTAHASTWHTMNELAGLDLTQRP